MSSFIDVNIEEHPQMTLGDLLDTLQTMINEYGDIQLEGVTLDGGSYRGYYDCFYLEKGNCWASEMITFLEDKVIDYEYCGYKGGDYMMTTETPVFVASYGCTGEKLIGIRSNGCIQTQEDY